MLRTHHPTLGAAAVLAERQGVHLAAADGYVAAHLSDLDAFCGVLSLFRDEYAAALGHVHAGLDASAARADLLAQAFLTCRRLYVEADEAAAQELGATGDAVAEVVAVVPAGHVSDQPPTPVTDASSDDSGAKQRIPLEDRGGTPIESPTQALLDGAQDVHDSAQSLASGVHDLQETLDDLTAYDDFEAAS